ncbi:MAG: alpha/beta hydrolase [Acidobacteria bacterium]|nr:alpha/beta hydrolase [Acidobacteriota bacterium]
MTAITASDGVRLEVVESGDPGGRTVVLIAGFKAPATSWRYQVGALAEAGHRVLAVDLRGHGAAERPESGVDMDRRGDDVRDVLAALELSDVTLIGGSMGGNTIWSYLSRHGGGLVRAAIVVDQTPKMVNTADWPHGFYGFDTSNMDTFFAATIPDTGRGTPLGRRGMRLVRLLRALERGDRTLTPGELALLNDHARRDWRAAIAGSAVPVLFVAGADSEYWPAAHAAAAAALAPHGRSVVLEHDGHAANIEQPRAFNRAMLDFLSRT